MVILGNSNMVTLGDSNMWVRSSHDEASCAAGSSV